VASGHGGRTGSWWPVIRAVAAYVARKFLLGVRLWGTVMLHRAGGVVVDVCSRSLLPSVNPGRRF